MAKKETFEDRTLIRLRREYSKDEAVAALSKKLTEKDVEIGVLSAEVDHLTSELNTLIDQKEINKQARKEVRKDEMYKQLLVANRKLREQRKELRRVRNELLVENSMLKTEKQALA
jgi:hypothetical protein